MRCWIAVVTVAYMSVRSVAQTKPAAVLPAAPEGVTIQADVSYLQPARKEKLDLYLPADRAADVRSPGVVIIHGGGWVNGDKSSAREFNIGTTLAKAGYVCASVEYEKEAGKRWPTNLLDCKNAVRFLRANAEKYQIDVAHIGVIGGSAGGHLALMVAYTSGIKELEPDAPYPGVSDAVSACVDMYGITDLLTRCETDLHGNATAKLHSNDLFKETRDASPEKWKLASPVYHIGKDSPPTLILHGTVDTTVDFDQSKELNAKLAEAGVVHQFFPIPGVGHTFDLQTWNHKPLTVDLRPVVRGFFDRWLKADTKGK